MGTPLYPSCRRVSPEHNSHLALHIIYTLPLLIGLVFCCIGCQISISKPPSDLTYPQASITASVGQAIPADTPTVTGTVDSYAVSPTLPAGLALNSSTGAISGTPTAVMPQASYTITAANQGGHTTATIQIAVNAVLTPPANLVYPQTSITAVVGHSISVDTPTVTGPVDSYTVSPALPSGLTLNSSTGAISGTPTAVTPQASYTITAANQAGSTSATVQIVVNAALVLPTNLVYPQTSITATVGQPIPVDTPTITGTSVRYSVSPTLPSGLTLNTSTGAISGTPTAVTARTAYTITAANQAGSTSATVQIVVNAALVLPTNLVYPQTSITASVGQPIPVDTPTVKGTVDSYSVSPALPSGLTMNTSTGAISGTPTAATPQATYTITAVNQAGHTSAMIQIVVNAVPPTNLVYPQTSITATVGQAIPVDTPTIKGTGVSYTVSPALPSGLALNTSTGAISGTPTAVTAGAAYTVTAVNQAGSTSATIQIVVKAAPPSNLVYPQTSILASVGQAIPVDTPTISGAGVSYTVSPDLPAGLALNTSTGAISGTPTAVTPPATYIIKASNRDGSTTTTIQIVVYATRPSKLSYFPQASIVTVVGQAITTAIPTVTGTVVSYTVAPDLPAGLTLNTANGAISGAPTATAPQATYTITAANAVGSTSTTIQITVNHALNVLLDLGHTTTMSSLRMAGSRMLSQDTARHWVLWDYASGKQLSNGDADYINGTVDIAGPILVIGVPNGLEIRSSSDGSLLSTIASPDIDSLLETTHWMIASDGSYICSISQNGLDIWTPGGQLIAHRPGYYLLAKIFAAPGQIFVALGPAGQNVIETISASDGTSVVGPAFSGQFSSWFLDGQRFLTYLSDTVWIYSNTAVQQSFYSLPGHDLSNLGGMGDWFWNYEASTFGHPLEIYSMDSPSPVATFDVGESIRIVPSGTTLGIIPYGTATTSVIDLSGPIPSKKDYVLPMAEESAYGAVSSSQWLMGNNHGVLLDGSSLSSTPRYFGLGQAWSISGSSNRTAIATASGTILYFDPSNATPEGTINFSSSKIGLSEDGSVLAAFADSNDYLYETDRTLNIYSLPSNTLTKSFPYTYGKMPTLLDFTLSGSGTALGQVTELGKIGSTINTQDQLTGISGSPLIWSQALPSCSASGCPILLSPDGTLSAVSTALSSDSVTDIWQSGRLIAAIPGYAVGWIDNNRILINNYASTGTNMYQGSAIYTFTGTKLSSPALPELHSLQMITDDTVYSPEWNEILSLTTGQPVWNNPYPFPGTAYPDFMGAVSGSYVVFVRQNYVFTDQYQLQQ